ncbi:hypothetical protein H4R21_000074 [Coemansia helicoidea]|uniref:Uncharacterized protein n=1 Tax=Coemansia helicoidea TaxID=1286919 RepID=A0ACC1LH34_9FUNG|nr:hypothetical protein H4R21_000074 [Coemansia helicoidea]
MKFTTIVTVALAAVAAAAPVHKREPQELALPASGEPAGNYLARVLAPLPLIGSLAAGLGLPPPKHA